MVTSKLGWKNDRRTRGASSEGQEVRSSEGQEARSSEGQEVRSAGGGAADATGGTAASGPAKKSKKHVFPPWNFLV